MPSSTSSSELGGDLRQTGRLLLRAALLLTPLVLGLWAIERWADSLPRQQPQYGMQYADLISGRAASEVIIFGGSRAAQGINPRFLDDTGEGSYNFAFNGATPRCYLTWYPEIYRRFLDSPKLLIYSVTWFMWDDVFLFRRIDQDGEYFTWPMFLQRWLSPEARRDVLLGNRFAIFRRRQEILEAWEAGSLGPRMHRDNPFKIDRFWRGFTPFESEYTDQHAQMVFDPRENEAQRTDFNRLLELLQGEGVRVVFVQTPEVLDGRRTNAYARNNEYLEIVARSHEIPFLNYNEELRSEVNADRSLFSDWTHMNPRGAEVFTRMLRRDLVALGALERGLLGDGS